LSINFTGIDNKTTAYHCTVRETVNTTSMLIKA